MESTLATAGSATGRVTFSHVFGQQCQLMEAGRKRFVGEVGCYPGAPGAEARVSVHLSVSSLSPCNLEYEVQLARDMCAGHIHFEVSRLCHGTECATWAG